jgi:hypothetical protein
MPLNRICLVSTWIGVWLRRKRFYIVTEYIIYPKKRSTKGSKSRHATTPVQQVHSSLAATLLAPPAGISLSAAPSPSASGSTTPSSRGADTPGVSTLEAAKSAASVRARKLREAGGVVCCFSVEEYGIVESGTTGVLERRATHLDRDEIDRSSRCRSSSFPDRPFVPAGRWSIGRAGVRIAAKQYRYTGHVHQARGNGRLEIQIRSQAH